VVQVPHVSLPIILHLHVLNLVFEYLPQLSILNSLNLIYFRCWHCRFEADFNISPFLCCLLEIDDLAVISSLDKTQSIVPMRREVVLLDFIDNFGEPQLNLLVLETDNLNASALDTYLEKIFIMRIELSHIGHDVWNHRAYKSTLA
jgi:hypothetical protein